MKGLLIKDLKLMKNARNSIVLILLVAVGMSAYVSDLSFITTYMAIIGATFSTSTISYDEFDNSNAFLFCLPVSRRDYVKEKYLFGLMMSGGGWLVGTLVSVAAGTMNGKMQPEEGVWLALMLLPIVACLVALLFPLRLKFEGDKSRIAMIILMGIVFAVFVLSAKVFRLLGIDLDALGERLSAVGPGTGMMIVAAVSVALLLLSCHISFRIMESKEF